MAKKKSTYICEQCNYQSPKWLGRCPDCGEWNSLNEQVFVQSASSIHARVSSYRNVENTPMKVEEISLSEGQRLEVGISEFDRVMGGGVTQGSLILVGGEPGIGKSTLLTEVMGRLASSYSNEVAIYISGEESTQQVAQRAKRLGLTNDNFFIFNETIWQNITTQLDKLRPKFVVLDSIQTTISNELDSAPGTVSQIREVTYELMNYVKAKGMTCFVIGHITKEGSIAGPKILEHMVDTVIYFEGDQLGHYRILRAIKNRFGNTNEVGIFEMTEKGLNAVPNPSQYFLNEQLGDAYGRSRTCIIEGTRSLFVEIQALVVENKFGNGRRTTQGLDVNRLSMLVAVIEKYLGVQLSYNDIYVNVVGGIKLNTRDSDLSIIASLLSSYRSSSIDSSTVFMGEVGLTGEVRSVSRPEMRLKEMKQLNYKRLITSEHTAKKYAKDYAPMEIVGIKRAKDILEYL